MYVPVSRCLISVSLDVGYISETEHHGFFCACCLWRWLGPLWWRCSLGICASGFVDEVIFSYPYGGATLYGSSLDAVCVRLNAHADRSLVLVMS